MRELPNPTLPLASISFKSQKRLPRHEESVPNFNLSVAWARSDEELREAQRLRYRVFAEEMGAHLNGPSGLDVDAFDAYCDHLLVRDANTLKVVGTYRVLPAASGGSHRQTLRRERIRYQPPRASTRQNGRGGPLLRTPRLPQRLGDHVAVGWAGRLHDAAWL